MDSLQDTNAQRVIKERVVPGQRPGTALCLLRSNHFLAHEFQDNAVDTSILEPAFFQVFAAAKLAKCVAYHIIIRIVNRSLIVAG